MESTTHSLNSLFDQLGLPSDSIAIESFIQSNSPLPKNTLLSEAQFWTATQASFLREETLNDADWVEVIDQLNTRLHSTD